MIEVRNVSRRYPGEPRDALSNASFSLPSKGAYLLVGPSGSGKTTLASILGLMDDGYRGEVLFDGQSYRSMDASRKALFRLSRVGFSFQGGFLDPKNTVEDELLKALSGAPLDREEKRRRVAEELLFFEMGSYAKRKVGGLSGGEKKRISLARAWIRKASLVILDEPTAGLNPALAEKVFDRIRSLAEDALVLVITHDAIDSRGFGKIVVNDGKATLVQDPWPRREAEGKKAESGRVSFGALLWLSFKTFLRHFQSAGPAMMAIVIALTSFGIALFLVDGVKEGFLRMGSDAFDRTTAVVEAKANAHIGGQDVLLSQEEAQRVGWDFQDLVEGSGVEYRVNLDDKVETTSSLYFFPNPNYRYPENFGLNPVAHPLWTKVHPEMTLVGIYLPTLRDDQIYLGLPSSAIGHLLTAFPSLVDDMRNGRATLKGELSVKGVSGSRSFALQVMGLFESESPALLHSSSTFAETLLEEVVGFESSHRLNALDPKPHTLKKGGVLYVRKDQLSAFFRSFHQSPRYASWTLEKFPASLAPHTGLSEGYEKLFIRPKVDREVAPHDLLDMGEREDLSLSEYAFSSSVYTYVQGGLYAGFSLPVFLSSKRSDLVELSEKNKTTDRNLGMFQIADKEIPEGVIGADLTSSLKGEGILFRSPLDQRVDLGRFPRGDFEIALSSDLAQALHRGEDPVGKTLCLLLLGDVRKEGNSYRNIFYDRDLKVSGVVNEEGHSLYHDAFFPTSLAFQMTDKSGRELSSGSAVLKFRSVEAMEKSLPKLRLEYPAYDFSSPFRDLALELEAILQKISQALCLFASIGLLLSVFLMALTAHLAVKEDEKGIGDYLALGFSHGKTRLTYLFYVLWIGLASFLQSCLAIALGQRIAGAELAKVFGEVAFSFSLKPYLSVFALDLGISLLVSALATRGIGKLDPRSGFRLP